MRPTKGKLVVSDEARDVFMIHRELGKALRRSFDAMTTEPLPAAMEELLLRIALAEEVVPQSTDEQKSKEGQ
jgi:hypothetical protein